MGLYYLQSRYYDPEIGRFLNADAFISTGQGELGNNMFAYCANNPVIHYDPSGNYYCVLGVEMYGFLVHTLSQYIGSGGSSCSNIVSTSQKEKTVARGITGSGAFIGGVYFSFGYTYDAHGNIGLIFEHGSGGGSPSASISAYKTITNAPDIYKQAGLGMSMGGSVSLFGLPVSIGGEYNMLLNDSLDLVYHGHTITEGLGIGLPGEFHGYIGHTTVIGIRLPWSTD